MSYVVCLCSIFKGNWDFYLKNQMKKTVWIPLVLVFDDLIKWIFIILTKSWLYIA